MNYRVKLCTIILVTLFALCGTFVLAAPENEEGGEATTVTEAPTISPTEPPTKLPTQPPTTEATEPPVTEPPTNRPTEAPTQPATSSPNNNNNNNDNNGGQDSTTRPRSTSGQSAQSEKIPSTDSIFVERTMPVSPTHIVTDEEGGTYYATNSYLSNNDGGSGGWLKYLIPSILIVIAIGVIFYVNFVLYNKKHNADKIQRNLYSPAESSRKNKRRKK